jgi:hypothetical protein
MKTALICFDGGNEYTKDKQIRHILKEENEQFGINCKDYDELDSLIPILKEHNITKLIILHEDKNLDRFEVAVNQEYNHLFEKIEVLPEGFIRLQEIQGPITGAAQAGGAGTDARQGSSVRVVGQNLNTKQQNPGTATFSKIVIFGPNPILAGTSDLITAEDDVLIVSLLSLKCAQTGLWNFSAPSIGVHKKMREIKEFAYGRTIEGILGAFNIQPANAPNIVSYLGNVPNNFLTNDATLAGKITIGGGNYDQSSAVAAYKIGVEILNGKAKPDVKKCEEWEQERIGLLGFLIKMLGDIKHSLTVGDQEEANKDGHSVVNQVLETLGAYKDIATAAKNLRTGGLGLLVDAAEIVSKNLSKQKERKEKKSDSLISHPKFEEFAGYFCKDLNEAKKEFVEV